MQLEISKTLSAPVAWKIVVAGQILAFEDTKLAALAYAVKFVASRWKRHRLPASVFVESESGKLVRHFVVGPHEPHADDEHGIAKSSDSTPADTGEARAE